VYASRGNGLTYGWNVDHTAYTREHRDGADRRLATLCRFRSGGEWEIAVPNGTYNVTVAIGDGDFASAHTIHVEGTVFWNAENLAAGQFANRTLAITVGDGRLTIDQGGAAHEETRIGYVLVAAEGAPPAAPGALTAAAVSPGSVGLKWGDHSSMETGFQVWRSTGADFATGTLIATTGPDQTSHTDAGLTAGTTYYYRVRATGAAGDSAFSNAAAATPQMPDLDADRIPDSLESAPFAAGTDDREVDSDGDGISNADEYLAGTDPMNSASRLQLAPLIETGGEAGEIAVTLSFSSVAGLHYAVDFTDSVDGGVWTLVPGSERMGDGGLQSVGEITTSLSRFYRLLAWR
jgi:Bacterial TSP3 repeat